jgi:hypothetical protein
VRCVVVVERVCCVVVVERVCFVVVVSLHRLPEQSLG